jgi:hypothetical protein
MTNFFSFFPNTKVAKLVLSGELDNFQPFGILLKGFKDGNLIYQSDVYIKYWVEESNSLLKVGADITGD